MNSCLYECEVMHHRLHPKVHRFSYRIFLFSLDLDELPSLTARLPWFGHNRRRLYNFRDADHYSASGQTVKESVASFLRAKGVDLPADFRIRLVTLPRILGYVFNPVSFYFCLTSDGQPITALAEVRNTFHEMKLFHVPATSVENQFRLIAPKHYYVSPFSTLDTHFDFRFQLPEDRLSLHVDDLVDGRTTLVSHLRGERRSLTSARLLWYLIKYPLLTLRIIFLIHWHALLLWIKRVPYFLKTDQPENQREVLRPHSSLKTR